MGSRVGYRVKDKENVSQIFRKQWFHSIKETAIKMWDTLDKGAIRGDLSIERGFPALIFSIYSAPFDSVEKDTKCDIADNGLIEFDMSIYNNWKIYHYSVGNYDVVVKKYAEFPFYGRVPDGDEFDWGKLSNKKTLVAEINNKGFVWKVTPILLFALGEGLC